MVMRWSGQLFAPRVPSRVPRSRSGGPPSVVRLAPAAGPALVRLLRHPAVTPPWLAPPRRTCCTAAGSTRSRSRTRPN